MGRNSTVSLKKCLKPTARVSSSNINKLILPKSRGPKEDLNKTKKMKQANITFRKLKKENTFKQASNNPLS